MKFTNAEGFKILVDRLKNGHVEEIKEEFASDFIDVHEERLAFESPVFVEGRAYLADADLIVCLDIATEAVIPCSICNEPVKVPIQLKGVYFNEPLAEIKTGIYSLIDPLREAILIETPTFTECGGRCQKRKELEKYFKKPDSKEEYHPFEHLKFDEKE